MMFHSVQQKTFRLFQSWYFKGQNPLKKACVRGGRGGKAINCYNRNRRLHFGPPSLRCRLASAFQGLRADRAKKKT